MLVVVFGKDLGTALLFFGIFLTMLFVATGRRSYVLIGLAPVPGRLVRRVAAVRARRASRVDAWIDPFADPSGARLPDGAGALRLRARRPLRRGAGPVAAADRRRPRSSGSRPTSSSRSIAEELGADRRLCALLALVLALVFRGLRVAMLARDDFSAMLAVGLTVSLGLQTLIIAAGDREADPADRHHLPVRQLRRLEPAGQLHRDRAAAGDQPPFGGGGQSGGSRTVIAAQRPPARGLPRARLRHACPAALGWWQVVDAQALAARQDNPEVIAARRSLPRGSIFDVAGRLLASSQVVDGISRRTYPDPAFTHLIGYASLRFGTTGLERVWDDILTGRTDPNPLNDMVNDVLGRQPRSARPDADRRPAAAGLRRRAARHPTSGRWWPSTRAPARSWP